MMNNLGRSWDVTTFIMPRLALSRLQHGNTNFVSKKCIHLISGQYVVRISIINHFSLSSDTLKGASNKKWVNVPTITLLLILGQRNTGLPSDIANFLQISLLGNIKLRYYYFRIH